MELVRKNNPAKKIDIAMTIQPIPLYTPTMPAIFSVVLPDTKRAAINGERTVPIPANDWAKLMRVERWAVGPHLTTYGLADRSRVATPRPTTKQAATMPASFPATAIMMKFPVPKIKRPAMKAKRYPQCLITGPAIPKTATGYAA